MVSPRSIVVVKLSAIGDVLHGVPAAVALKRAFPAASIGWVVEGRAADVLAGHPAVDHLFRLPRGWLTAPRSVLALRRQLRAFQADVAIDLQGLLKSGVATWLSGAAMRIGPAPPVSREHAWLAYTHPVRPTAAHVVDRNCQLLTPLGIHVPQPTFDMPDWPVSRLRMRQWVASLRLPRPPVVLNPGAGWPSKLWPVERFAAAARGLHRRHGRAAGRRPDRRRLLRRGDRGPRHEPAGPGRALPARHALHLVRHRAPAPRGGRGHALHRTLRTGAGRAERPLRPPARLR